MDNNVLVYKTWAPANSPWTPWAKPALFAGPQYGFGKDMGLSAGRTNWMPAVRYDTMIILDLPGENGVEEALGLAQLGYRPVPLYNGVGVGADNYSMIVDIREIVSALHIGANTLARLNVRADAPPAFMLDYNRMIGRGKEPGKYDNRWCVFPQDMPSAEFLIKQGIKNVTVRSPHILGDLSHILCRYQERGIRIYHCNDGSLPKPVTVSKPSQFKSLIYRFQVTFGLTRNATGGFGGKIPEPMQRSGGTSVGYYRFG